MFQDITYTVQLADVDTRLLSEEISNCSEPFKIFGLNTEEWERVTISGVCLDTGDKLTIEICEGGLLYIYEPVGQEGMVSSRFINTLSSYVSVRGGSIKAEKNENKIMQRSVDYLLTQAHDS